MIRSTLALFLMLIPWASAPLAVQTPTREVSEMPVWAIYCETDPGEVDATGGKGPHPSSLVENGTCDAAEGVAVTFVVADDDWDFEDDDIDDFHDWEVEDNAWFARCDTDADGFCPLEAPVGIDVMLGAVLHHNTVKPGYEPVHFRPYTQNFTEFTGFAVVLVPSDSTAVPDAEPADHQTLALKIDRSNEPTSILTEWEINDNDGDVFLATNDDGWVSNIVAGNDVVEIELLNVNDRSTVTVVCGVNDDAAIEVPVSVDGDDLTIRVPDTDSDLRCDVVIVD